MKLESWEGKQVVLNWSSECFLVKEKYLLQFILEYTIPESDKRMPLKIIFLPL